MFLTFTCRVKKVLFMRYVNVAREYRGQGIMGRLVETCLLEFRKQQRGHEAILAGCSNYYVHRKCLQLGMKLLLELDYSEMDNYKKMADYQTHSKLRLMALKCGG